MRSSSPTIGALAAALAAAQGELVNPEKTARGSIPPMRPGGEARVFRYATLSAGLDAARGALSRREIALMQTTFVDREEGWLRLQSVLAHTSGEWIAGDWPVCPLSVALEPHRLGTALTYARRYALFALVGIAGDDDLDAPDLEITAVAAVAPRFCVVNSLADTHADRLADPLIEDAAPYPPSSPPQEAPQARKARLIAEIERIDSPEELWRWAYRRLVEKNALPRALALAVERRFEEQARSLQADETEGGEEAEALGTAGTVEPRSVDGRALARTDREDAPAGGGGARCPKAMAGAETMANTQTQADDVGPAAAPDARALSTPEPDADRRPLLAREPGAKALPAAEPAPPDVMAPAVELFPRPVTPKTQRLRDKAHRQAVAHRPCLVCGRSPADPHHLRFAQPRALGAKSSDEFVVPLCRIHHDELHKRGDERAWWKERQIDPIAIALDLWRASHARKGTSEAVSSGIDP